MMDRSSYFVKLLPANLNISNHFLITFILYLGFVSMQQNMLVFFPLPQNKLIENFDSPP